MSRPITAEFGSAQVAAANVPVADTITIFRAVSAFTPSIAQAYGRIFAAQLLEAAESDMRAAIEGNCDREAIRTAVEAQLKLTQLLAQTTKELEQVPLTQETGAVDVVGIDSASAAVTVVEEIVHDFDLPRYQPTRANVPLMWFLPVRQTVEMQAARGITEDDRVRAAELLVRARQSPYVEHVASVLATAAVAEATSELALVQ